MKLVTFQGDDGERLGAVLHDGVLDLSIVASILGVVNFPGDMQGLIEAGASGLEQAWALLSAAPRAAAPFP